MPLTFGPLASATVAAALEQAVQKEMQQAVELEEITATPRSLNTSRENANC